MDFAGQILTPITGQAAWYDLKVSIQKADPDDPGIYPTFPTIESPGKLEKPASTVTYGIQFQHKRGSLMTMLPENLARKNLVW